MTREESVKWGDLRVALVHFWHVRRGGAERVLEVMAEIFPHADLFVPVADPQTMAPALRQHRLITSYLQHWPGSRRFHRFYLPLYPLALEQFDLSGYDLVISNEAGPAKGVITGPNTCHICYCHSPMRYLWQMSHEYRRGMPGGPIGRALFAVGTHYLRQWDLASAARVDHFVANCQTVAQRVRKFYRRECDVIYPPLDMAMSMSREPLPAGRPGDYYLVVSRLVAYKRVDLAIAACRKLGRRLVLIGGGEERRRLERLAGGDGRITFLGETSDRELLTYYQGCRALVFPGEEDFGATPVEAQACGRPVVALGRGGALETVRGWESGSRDATGVFFAEPTVESLSTALRHFEEHEEDFDSARIRISVARFDHAQFRERLLALVEEKLGRARFKMAAG